MLKISNSDFDHFYAAIRQIDLQIFWLFLQNESGKPTIEFHYIELARGADCGNNIKYKSAK